MHSWTLHQAKAYLQDGLKAKVLPVPERELAGLGARQAAPPLRGPRHRIDARAHLRGAAACGCAVTTYPTVQSAEGPTPSCVASTRVRRGLERTLFQLMCTKVVAKELAGSPKYPVGGSI